MMDKIKKAIPYVILLLLAILYLFPFLIMFTTSFKTNAEAFEAGAGLFPRKITFENYRNVFEVIPFGRYLGNTLFITLFNMAGAILVTPMIAYSLSKLRWRGRRIIFTIVMSTMLIPYTATMIPLYKLWVSFGLIGTYVPLILPAFFGYPYYIVIMRQFMLSLPDELFEAATIDGCGHMRRFFNIAFPLSTPGITTVAIFSFLFTFSDFLGPLLYINKQTQFTLSLGLQAFLNEHTVEWTSLMAASVMFILPVLLLFIFAQRYFIEGIATTGIK